MARSRCLVTGCRWVVEGPLKDIVGCAASWHVYEEHPEVWLGMFGERPPVDPDPRTEEGLMLIVGRNLEEAVDYALSQELERVLGEGGND